MLRNLQNFCWAFIVAQNHYMSLVNSWNDSIQSVTMMGTVRSNFFFFLLITGKD